MTPPAPRRFDDPLFARFPISGDHTLSTGAVCHSPFFVPDSEVWMIFGTADLAVVRALTDGERYHPIESADHALACLWLTDFKDSTAGPYQELTLTFMVSREPRALPWVNPFTPVAAQLRDGTLVCEHVLVVDNPDAIAYGRELHGFDKHAGAFAFTTIDGPDGPVRRVLVTQAGQLVVDAHLSHAAGPWARASAAVAMACALGVRKLVKETLRSTHATRVVTPSVVMATTTDIHFQGTPVLRAVGNADRLQFGAESAVGATLGSLGFRPLAIQYLPNAKGIMPLPH